jgi:ABC-2 type transport system ATP-binding protein
VIRVEHLTKAYGPLVAIDSLDFEIRKGEIAGFLGANGAGKTTTMRILCGSLGASSGRAYVNGIDVVENPRAVKRIVGYLPEVPPLYTEMTVRGFLRFCARIKKADDIERSVDRVIDEVGLRDVAHRLVDHLSKGYRQRVGLAQALVHRPQVLVLDEPTSGLDPAQRVEIRELVRTLAQGDVTVVLSTHVLSEVEDLCNRVMIIHRGRIVAQDDVRTLAARGGDVRVRVSRPGPAAHEALRRVAGVTEVVAEEDGVYAITATRDAREDLAAAAVPHGLLELGARRGLEDVFLELTRDAA